MFKIPNTDSYLFLIRHIATIIIIIRIKPPAAPPAAAATFTGDCPSNRGGVTVSSRGVLSDIVSSRGVLSDIVSSRGLLSATESSRGVPSAVREEVSVVVVTVVVVGSVIHY